MEGSQLTFVLLCFYFLHFGIFERLVFVESDKDKIQEYYNDSDKNPTAIFSFSKDDTMGALAPGTDVFWSVSYDLNHRNNVFKAALCSDLRTTFFNEQQYAWGFGLQNDTGVAVDSWEVSLTNANYQLNPTQLTNQAAFIYSEIDNGNGTYNLTLTGTSAIPAYGGIPGGNIEWPGVNFGFNANSDGIIISCGGVAAPQTVITNKRITYRVKN